MTRRILFVDANNLAARSFYAMRELSTLEERTGAIYGFLKGLGWCRYKTQIPLSDTVIVWDGGHSLKRLEIFDGYKKARKLNEPATPQEEADKESYHKQSNHIREIMECLEVRQIQVSDVEADDLISIFSTFVCKSKLRSLIFSGDGDFHQLFNASTSIWDPKKELLGLGDIEHKWRTTDIRQIPFIRAIAGDASDGIDGIKTVGIKRASICSQYLNYWRSTKHAYGFEIKVKVKGWEKPDAKWVDLVLERKNQRKIQRNLALMVLPEDWERSFYTYEQAEAAMTQWLAPRTKNRRRFIELLERFELSSILENLSNW